MQKLCDIYIHMMKANWDERYMIPYLRGTLVSDLRRQRCRATWGWGRGVVRLLLSLGGVQFRMMEKFWAGRWYGANSGMCQATELYLKMIKTELPWKSSD